MALQRIIFFTTLLAGIVSAQVTFTLRTPQELGIDSVFGYNRCSFVDYNQDGWLDFFTNVVYLNDGTGNFTRLDSTRITNSEVVDWGDFDGDALPDLVTNRKWGGNTEDTNYIFVYRNEGAPHWTLRDVSDSVGLGFSYPIYNRDLVDPAWFDYDGDGWLDFFLTSYEYPVNSAQAHPDHLFHNHGGRCFAETSDSSCVDWVWRCSRGAGLFDYDEDGDIDIFVSVYRLQANILFENQGDGTFFDVAGAKGVTGLYISGYYGHNIGAALADYDNDGHIDIFTPITHHAGYPGDSTGHLWISNGPPDWDFTCRFPGSGLRNSEIGSSPSCADFDNDGDVDLMYVNLYGAPRPDAWLFRNDGDCRFVDVTDSVGLGVHQRLNYALWADYNHDGLIDIFWARHDGSAYHYEFYENQGGTGNHWLEIDLAATLPNHFGIGARIDAFAGNLRVTREVLHNQGHHYGSMFVARQHLGLGQHRIVDSVIVRWPDGGRDVFLGLPADTTITLVQSSPGISGRSANSKPRSATPRLRACPNPFAHSTKVTNARGRFRVFDPTGRLVQVVRKTSFGADLAPGVYYLSTPGCRSLLITKTPD
ncbi:MAG: CRTAC1 family protein [candidate division WOR-3 bacterium]|nr:MAG: CRTAC1 family protein [candidate division WOR-3 bacterium]